MGADEDEDDYMSAAFLEPVSTKPETSLQKQARLRNERAERGRQLSKRERERLEREKQEADLATSLMDSSTNNKGLKMMQKLGYKPGETLGKSGDGLKQPISIKRRDSRGGIGADAEKKRKAREAFAAKEEGVKRSKVDVDKFAERTRKEAEDARLEVEVEKAMKSAESLDEQERERASDEGEDEEPGTGGRPKANVLWRGLYRSREQREAEKRAKYANYNDIASLKRERKDRVEDTSHEEYDDDDRVALGLDPLPSFATEVADDDDDRELDEFEALEPAVKLEKLVMHMRENHHYCFWCKAKYESQDMDGCPGIKEDEHD